MSLPKFNKLYFPGLISLAFLPLLCIWYFTSIDTFHQYRAMGFVWAPKAILNKWLSSPGKKGDIDSFRKYQIINISGNIIQDAKEIEMLKTLLKHLYQKNDTINGIKVALGHHAHYDEFVNVYDICCQDKDLGLFVDPIGYEIFIGHNDPYKKVSNGVTVHDIMFTDANDRLNNQKPVFTSIEKIQTYVQEMYGILIEFWPSVMVFILMILLTVSKTQRYLSLKSSSN